MAFDYVCPKPAALSTINRGCIENWGEIRHIVFGRKGLISFDSGASPAEDITVKADWDTKLAAVDDTKLIVLPNVRKFVSQDSSFYEAGEDESIGGVAEIIGVKNQVVDGIARSVKGSIHKQIQELMTEELEVIFINEYGKIISNDISDALDGSVLAGFPILSFGITPAKIGGKAAFDDSMFKFAFEDVFYRNNAVISTPAAGFNPLIDLLPAFEA